MRFTRLVVKNWKNFGECEMELGDRIFLVGPNAAGKSNLLDVFHFLRDLALPDGGLQRAVQQRGGYHCIKSLFAKKSAYIDIEVELCDNKGQDWKYTLSIGQETKKSKRPIVLLEAVYLNDEQLFYRPTDEDVSDEELQTQTWLEQISLNKEFRQLATVFKNIQYLHLVPQILRDSNRLNGELSSFGGDFLRQIMQTPVRSRIAKLKKIEAAFQKTIPGIDSLSIVRDEIDATPHLEIKNSNWVNGTRQRENQLSDGTIRLIGLLWKVLDEDSLLLLEEPEISLHSQIVKKLPSMIWRLQNSKKHRRQVFMSTHSFELLSDKGIRSDEIFLIRPSKSGASTVTQGIQDAEITQLMSHGLSAADVAIPATNSSQLELFDEPCRRTSVSL